MSICMVYNQDVFLDAVKKLSPFKFENILIFLILFSFIILIQVLASVLAYRTASIIW
jgi:hypothetical protein